MKKIYVYFSGGLGNQLFEYAAAKNLALKNNAKLLLDIRTGFLTDFRDSTKFSLNKNLLKDVKFFNFSFFFLFFRIFKKIFRLKNSKYNFLTSKIIDETNHQVFDEKIKNIQFKNNLYLMGYFQSESYFNDNKDIIVKEIFPPEPKDKKYLELKEKISHQSSIAVGVRMHENIDKEFGFKINKSRKEKMISGIGGITPVSFYLNALDNMKKKIENPNFFLFSTKASNLTKIIKDSEILKKYPVEIITADKGFEDAYDNLWLMSHCKNFVISNSTLYWWAAYFSKVKFNSKNVICSHRFPNKDIYLEGWEKIQ